MQISSDTLFQKYDFKMISRPRYPIMIFYPHTVLTTYHLILSIFNSYKIKPY